MCCCANAEAVVVVRLVVVLFVISSPWSTGGSVVISLDGCQRCLPQRCVCGIKNTTLVALPIPATVPTVQLFSLCCGACEDKEKLLVLCMAYIGLEA